MRTGRTCGSSRRCSIRSTASSRRRQHATTINWEPMRRVGAAGRQMLSRRRQTLGGTCERVRCEPGVVRHSGAGEALDYGALAAKAGDDAGAGPRSTVALKDPKDYRIIGQFTPGVDSPLDPRRASRSSASTPACPACATPCIRRPRCSAAELSSANLDGGKGMPGVRDVFVVHATGARGDARRWAWSTG